MLLKEIKSPPQSGLSSGKPATFKADAQVEIREMTLDEILAEVKGIPYVNDVLGDWDKQDFRWIVMKKVVEYAKYLKHNPESIKNLPPLVVIDGNLNDGAHRISAINLLRHRMDKDNPKWAQVKLEVMFGSSHDVEKYGEPPESARGAS